MFFIRLKIFVSNFKNYMRILNKLFFKNYYEYVSNFYRNSSFIISEYTQSQINGTVSNELKFMTNIHIKMGVRFVYKNFWNSFQYSYVSGQFCDATNSKDVSASGVTREIPADYILDLSVSYKHKFMKLETGIHNFLNNSYFTRKATGYTESGIITSSNRNYYVSLNFKI